MCLVKPAWTDWPGVRVITAGRLHAIEKAEPGWSALLVPASDSYGFQLVREFGVVGWADFEDPDGTRRRYGLCDVFVSPASLNKHPGPDLTAVPGWESLDGLTFAEHDPCFVAYLSPGCDTAAVLRACYERRKLWHEQGRVRADARRRRLDLYGPEGWYVSGRRSWASGIGGWGREEREWLRMIAYADPTFRGREAIDPYLRAIVLRRSGAACVYCGNVAERMHVDHVIPVARGGRTVEENLVGACQPCNSRKSARLPTPAELADLRERFGLAIEFPEERP